VAWRTSWFSPRVQFRAWIDQQGAVRTVYLAGRLGREHAAELLRICDVAPGALRVDLANLVSAEQVGLDALTELESRGAALTGTSPYLALRLQNARAARTGRQRSAGSAGSATQSRTSNAGETQGREAQ